MVLAMRGGPHRSGQSTAMHRRGHEPKWLRVAGGSLSISLSLSLSLSLSIYIYIYIHIIERERCVATSLAPWLLPGICIEPGSCIERLTLS